MRARRSALDDGNACTTDTCNVATGVQHTPASAGTSCLDGNACNGAEACNGAGACTAGSAPVVDDGNVCTVDACDPITGVSHAPASVGVSCSDGNPCNGAEACNGAGACAAGTPPVVDDGNACTTDSCNAATGVQHTPVASGTACSDGNACNGAETCNGAGSCAAGTAPVVDDGNACTADTCDAVAGVRHTALAAGASCSDGNACNGAETCNGAAACAPGVPLMVDDGNACTTDACDVILGVSHAPTATGSSCSDGNVCNGPDTCNGAGVCTTGMAPVVDDGNPCTVDSCDIMSGVSHVAAAPGTACSDGNACNGNEVCNATQCETGAPLVVDDGNACTTDTCDAVRGVSHTRIAGCVPSGSTDDTIFERRASFFGTAFLTGGAPATGISVSVFDDGATPTLRTDVAVSTAADGSFRVRLAAFPESAPLTAAAQHLIVRVHAEGTIDAVRDLYVSPRSAGDLGRIELTTRDPKETIIGPEGGRATDSQGLVEVVIPAGALAAPIPIHVTPLPTRESMALPLPPQTATTYAFDLSPDGTHFDAPITVRVANTRALPTALEIPVGYADLDHARWLHVDMARWDGSRFAFKTSHFSEYDVNALVVKTRWRKIASSGPDPSDSEQTCSASTTGLANGGSMQSMPLVSYERHGRTYGVTLNYDGHHAGQTILPSMNAAPAVPPTNPPAGAPVPTTTTSFPSSSISMSTSGVEGHEVCVTSGSMLVFSPLCGNVDPGGTGGGGGGGGADAPCTLGATRSLQDSSVTAPPAGAAPSSTGTETQAMLPLDDSGNLSGPYFEARRVKFDVGVNVAIGSGGPFGGQPACSITSATLAGGAFRYTRYAFVNHRNTSAFGIGWTPSALNRLYVDPYGGQAVIVKGSGETEKFVPRAFEHPLTTTNFDAAAAVLARDPLTGEVFSAEDAPANAIKKLGISATAATAANVVATTFTSEPSTMAIVYVGAVRHFVVATPTGLVDVPESGSSRTLIARAAVFPRETSQTYPQVAASGAYVYYHDGKDAPAPTGSKLLRIRLDAPSPVVETLTGAAPVWP